MDGSKYLYLLFLIQNLLPKSSCKGHREFFLSEIGVCDKSESYIIEPNFTYANITKNMMCLKGSAHITENLSDKFAILLRYKKMRFGSKEFTRTTDFPIPQPCMVINQKTVFGDPIGNSFTPRLTCPPKAGRYTFNFTFSMKKVADIPDLGIKYYADLVLLDPTKKKKVWCSKTVSWVRVVNK